MMLLLRVRPLPPRVKAVVGDIRDPYRLLYNIAALAFLALAAPFAKAYVETPMLNAQSKLLNYMTSCIGLRLLRRRALGDTIQLRALTSVSGWS